METSTFSSINASSPYDVRLGVWTNWSRGSSMGLTLTLTRQDADLVIAFTAFFVSFVGARFWRIICLACHRYFSSSDSEDTLHHQRQVVLRNSSTAESGLWVFIQLIWAWRRRAAKPLLRILPLCTIALLCTLAFVTAGGLSARMSTAIGDEVLMNGNNCSIFYPGAVENYTSAHAWEIWTSKILNNAFNYAQRCYTSDGIGSTGACGTLVKDRLLSLQNASASCPFEDHICRSQSSNLILDSGYVDSHTDLGLNSPPDERILFRYKKDQLIMRLTVHCAPLEVDGHTSSYTLFNVNYTRYNYGPNSGGKGNFTEQVRDLSSQYTNGNWTTGGVDYRLTASQANFLNGTVLGNGASDFYPIPALQRKDADVTLLCLSGNGVVSVTPIDDPWFRMTKPYSPIHKADSSDTVMTYAMENAASPMGCTLQYQFCNAEKEKCGPLSSAQDALAGAAPLFNTTVELLNGDGPPTSQVASRMKWFLNVMSWYPANVYSVVRAQGAAGLLAKQGVTGGVQGPLPDDQWKAEITNWWAMVLALFQSMLVETARGVTDPSQARYRGLPEDAYQQDICYNQKIRSTLHGSFSMFALLFTYITGLLIIISSYLIEPTLRCLYRRNMYKQYQYLEWITDSELQQQRLAHEKAGSDDWEGCTDDVPVTKATVKLGRLDLADPNHPRILGTQGQEEKSLKTRDVHSDDTAEGEDDISTDLERGNSQVSETIVAQSIQGAGGSESSPNRSLSNVSTASPAQQIEMSEIPFAGQPVEPVIDMEQLDWMLHMEHIADRDTNIHLDDGDRLSLGGVENMTR
ncbi:hypothetical protein G7054_g1710 [Neopestalotiopsis clavispora]|nr:hypothetical protein G7054_g1710 [Neopestalotiopsis clavispora]